MFPQIVEVPEKLVGPWSLGPLWFSGISDARCKQDMSGDRLLPTSYTRLKNEEGSMSVEETQLKEILETLARIHMSLDAMGMARWEPNNSRPGALEKIAMELEGINRSLARLAAHFTPEAD